jgi:cell division protein FtsB
VASPSAARSARREAVRRRIAVAAALLVVAGALLAVPTRNYLAQRSEIAAVEADLSEVRRANERLAERRERLDRPEEIERIARRDFGLVEVGEESYSILPPATAGLVLPRSWPFDRISGAIERRSTASS